MERLKPVLRTARDIVYRIAYRGSGKYCPICETPARRFRPFGIDERREQAMCVYCRSLERHRLVWLFLERKTDLFAHTGVRFLHIAPEPCLEGRLRPSLGAGYVTGDMQDPGVDVRMDLTTIPYADQSFDVVYCSHVLEHVPDDRKAMRELRRVLAPNGFGIFQVPITVERTVEDPSVTDPNERLRLFGQDDHVRRYGPDFEDRMQEAGFRTHRIRAEDVADAGEIQVMGLTGSGEIFLATQ